MAVGGQKYAMIGGPYAIIEGTPYAITGSSQNYCDNRGPVRDNRGRAVRNNRFLAKLLRNTSNAEKVLVRRASGTQTSEKSNDFVWLCAGYLVRRTRALEYLIIRTRRYS